MQANLSVSQRRGDVVLLVARGLLAEWAARKLAERFSGLVILREEAETKAQIIRRRIRLCGLAPALGQVAAGLLFRAIAQLSRKRIAEVMIDDGPVIDQAPVRFAAGDTIATYQHVQMATGVELLGDAVEDALNGRLVTFKPQAPSRLWFPPPVWQYACNGAVKGVW